MANQISPVREPLRSISRARAGANKVSVADSAPEVSPAMAKDPVASRTVSSSDSGSTAKDMRARQLPSSGMRASRTASTAR